MRPGFINRLLSKYLIIQLDNGKRYYYKQNIEWDLLQEGDLLYEKLILKNRFSGLLKKDQVVRVLVERQQLDVNYKQLIARLEHQIRKDQVKLYEVYNQDPVSRDRAKQAVIRNRKRLEQMQRLVHSLDHTTLEGWADACRQEFLLANSLYDRRRKKIKPPLELLPVLFSKINAAYDSPRAIAKSDEWRFIWSSEKEQAFRYRPLTPIQYSVVNFSQMYDNIGSHPEKPSEDLINDDDALDGWLYKQKLKSEDKTKDTASSLGKKNQFVFVDSKVDADRVYMSNDIEARIVQQERSKKEVLEYAQR